MTARRPSPFKQKLAVAVLGATGMVGQRFVTLLANHPWFTVRVVAASRSSAGKRYREAVAGRWQGPRPIPRAIGNLTVRSALDDVATIAHEVALVFSAVDIDKDKDTVRTLEAAYAAAGVAVVSNTSAHRWTRDVPMILPEVNPEHLAMIPIQRTQRGWGTGFIVVKPNCSIQSYVPVLSALKQFEPTSVSVTTLQAISGAGKTFASWPEMVDNVIPFIGGEEEKSEREPLKVWATIQNGAFKLATEPTISATCLRVPVTDGHLAAVTVSFRHQPSKRQIVEALARFRNPLKRLGLPSAPALFLTYFDADDRPQTKLDRDLAGGMGISVGRLREDPGGGWKFVVLSHNTIRGAAGGAILLAELLVAKNYLERR